MRAVIFDYGLTLVSFDLPRDRLITAMSKVRPWLGPQPPEAEVLVDEVLLPMDEELAALPAGAIDHLTLHRRAWVRAGFQLSDSTLLQIIDLEQRCWDQAALPAPEALPTLEELRRRQLRTAVCSNAPFLPEMMRRQMRKTGISQRVDAVLLSTELGQAKPQPEMYAAALDRLHVSPSEALFVGDQILEDYEGPVQVGMQAVLCTALAKLPPPPGIPTISSLAQVLDLVS
jgi:putative hydrolase of the HAD superfamily